MTICINLYPMGQEGLIFNFGKGFQIWQRKNLKSNDKSDIVVKFSKKSSTSFKEMTKNILDLYKWNLVAVSYYYNRGEAWLYKNGEYVTSIDIDKTLLDTQLPIRLGSILDSSFNGLISCLQIYNVTLNPQQIKTSQFVCRQG